MADVLHMMGRCTCTSATPSCSSTSRPRFFDDRVDHKDQLFSVEVDMSCFDDIGSTCAGPVTARPSSRRSRTVLEDGGRKINMASTLFSTRKPPSWDTGQQSEDTGRPPGGGTTAPRTAVAVQAAPANKKTMLLHKLKNKNQREQSQSLFLLWRWWTATRPREKLHFLKKLGWLFLYLLNLFTLTTTTLAEVKYPRHEEDIPGHPDLVRVTYKLDDINGDEDDHLHNHVYKPVKEEFSVSSNSGASSAAAASSNKPIPGWQHASPIGSSEQSCSSGSCSKTAPNQHDTDSTHHIDHLGRKIPRRLFEEEADNLAAQRIRKETQEYERPKNLPPNKQHGDHYRALLKSRFPLDNDADKYEVDHEAGVIRQRFDHRPVVRLKETSGSAGKENDQQQLHDADFARGERGSKRQLEIDGVVDPAGVVIEAPIVENKSQQQDNTDHQNKKRIRTVAGRDENHFEERLKETTKQAETALQKYNEEVATTKRQLTEQFPNETEEQREKRSLQINTAATAALCASGEVSCFLKQEVCRGMDAARPGYFCGERWGITNVVKIEDQWEIADVEFFWDRQCDKPVQGSPRQQSFSDANANPPYKDISALAFDNNNKTAWLANCGADLGGCPAYDPTKQGQRVVNNVGPNTVIYQQLRKSDDPVTNPNNLPIYGNVMLFDPATMSGFTDGAIKCVRIHQSKITTRQAYHIAVVFWDTLQWVKYADYDALAGGGWQTRPPIGNTVWKLTNLNPTVSPWTVNELYFFGDRRCDYALHGIPIGRENVRQLPQCLPTPDNPAGTCEETSVEKIRDNDVTTAYRARCTQTVGVVEAPCSSGEAFVGYDYDSAPLTVLCIKMWSDAHAGYGQQWHKSQHSEALQLQVWDGQQWAGKKDLMNMLPNQWNYDYAPINTLWRITADEVIAEWRVAELEFYNNPFCDTTDDSGLVQVLPIQRIPLVGDAFDSNMVLGIDEEATACADTQILTTCARKVFDGKIDTFWRGLCRPGIPCERESNYIGMFSNTPIDVQCFKIYQSQDPQFSVSTVHISSWDGNGGWSIPNPWSALSSTIGGIQNDLGGGSWNRRPAFDYSMWKLSNAVVTTLQWRVVDVHLYSDKYCTTRMDGLAWIAAGSTGIANGVTMAADGHNQTFWECECLAATGGCDRFNAWLGVQRTYNKPAFLASNIPRCLVIDQFRDSAYQSADIRLETWNGIRWFDPAVEVGAASLTDYSGSWFYDLGGGTGHARPGFTGTQWRLKADDSVDCWQVYSLELFLDSECKPEKEVKFLTDNGARNPNVKAIGSGHVKGSELTAYVQRNEARIKADFGDDAINYLIDIDAGEEFPVFNAFDKNEQTSWVDIRDKSVLGTRGMENKQAQYPLFLGVDFGNSPTMNVNCIRIWQHSQFFSRNMKLEYWDGVRYAQKDYGIGQSWNLRGFSGGSWQRWPASYQTIWRIENAVMIPESWEIDELGFYDTVGCLATPLGTADDIIVSGYRGDHYGSLAMDGYVRSDMRERDDGGFVRYPNSFWRSGCGPCYPKDAYIGQDFGFQRRQVKCIRIFQAPAIERQSPIIDLTYWDPSQDKFVLDSDKKFYSIGGGSWNRRPAMSNSMFRLRWVQTRPKSKKCEAGRYRSFTRAWGVSEVEFFSDDKCESKIPLENNGREPGEPNQNIGSRQRNMVATVVSGGYKQIAAQASVTYDYYPLNVADGKFSTTWAADCRTAINGVISDEAYCSNRDWVGFDFGAPKTVKCIKIVQSRADLNACCDPLIRMSMDRWNGTDWVVSTWRHEPQDDGSRPAVLVNADFSNMGQCGNNFVEMRGRKETESCSIPLSSITRTLGHPLCIKHDWCTEIGFRGTCCPIDKVDHRSRCCCTYLKTVPIFVDEIPLEDRGEAYDKMDLEMVTISWTKVLPFWFMIMTVIWFTLVNIQEPPKDHKYYIYWERHCLPLQRWFDGEGYAQRFLRNFRLKPEEPPHMKVGKGLFIAITFFILGGALIWIILAYVIAEFILFCYFMAILVVKFCKSVYFPGHDHDEWRRHAITQIAINPDQSDVKYPSSLSLIKTMGVTFAFTFFFWARWVFDLLLFQSILFIMGLGDTNISAYMIMDQVPRVSIPAFDAAIESATNMMRGVLGLMPMTYMEVLFFFFNGIPRCKGPALLYGSMVFMAIALVLVKALNYDFFGLFAAGRHAIATTKPGCQKALILFWNFTSEGFFFITAQCALVAMQMFKDLALPGPQNWMCPWDDSIVVVIAMSMLYLLLIATIIIVILCANGHFYGQDYILGPLGKELGMNFDRLDPDGTGPEGGMINLEVLFAVLPTTVGVWQDDWNVAAYLMVERAHVYAEELWTPTKCDICQEIHVPYEDLIRAQSRNVSLCYQALPFGLALGKLCEYMNFPPLYYDGRKMKCLLKVKHSRRVEFEFYGVMMNKYLPMASAVFSFGLYLQLIITIMIMTEANISSVATSSFIAALVLCFFKSLLHVFARQFVLYLEGKRMEAFLKANPRAKPPPTEEELKRIEKEKQLGIQKHQLPNMRILLGQLAHGIVVGSVYGGLAVSGELISDTAGLWVGMCIGLAGGWVPIYLYYLTEMPSVPTFTVGLIKTTFAAIIAIGAFFVSDEAGYSFRFCQIMSSVCFTLIALPAVVCFRRRTYDEHGQLSPSLTYEILFTYRGIPNYLAIITAMFITCIPATMLIPKPLDGSEKQRVIDGITTQGKYRDLDAEKDELGYVLFGLIFASYLVGIMAAYLVAEQLHKKPVVMAIASGYMLILALQPFMFILFALFIGTLFGLSVGAYIEKREVQRIKGISLHDRIQVYGDLAQADSKASRVAIQKEQQRQAFAIQNAIDEQRPICLPGETVTIEEFGDPEDPNYIAPLVLPAIPSVAEMVSQKMDEEEEISKSLKQQQANAAIQFASGLRDMQAAEQVVSTKLESMSSIGQVNSANPNRSLISSKKNMDRIRGAGSPLAIGDRQQPAIQGQAMEVLLALENRQGANRNLLPQLALPSAGDGMDGDIAEGEEEEEGNEEGVDADGMQIEIPKTPVVPPTDGDQMTGHELVLKEEQQAYSFDETVHQWYDPHTGYYYDDTKQEWYMPGDKEKQAATGPPQAIRPISLRSQADHIQRMQDRKKSGRRGAL